MQEMQKPKKRAFHQYKHGVQAARSCNWLTERQETTYEGSPRGFSRVPVTTRSLFSDDRKPENADGRPSSAKQPALTFVNPDLLVGDRAHRQQQERRLVIA